MKTRVFCPDCCMEYQHTLLDMMWVCDNCGGISEPYDFDLDGPLPKNEKEEKEQPNDHHTEE